MTATPIHWRTLEATTPAAIRAKWSPRWKALAFRLAHVVRMEREDSEALQAALEKVSRQLADTGARLDLLTRRARAVQAFLSQYEGAAKEGARMISEALDHA